MTTQSDERQLGAFHKGVVYVMASEHNSAKQVEETVFHKVYPRVEYAARRAAADYADAATVNDGN